MERLKEIARRLRMLIRRGRFDRQLEDEMRLHQELRAQTIAAQGASTEEARLQASRRFGNALALCEQSHDAWGWRWLEDFFQDVHYGFRQLVTRPGFALIATLTLALGIGASTTIFSAVNPILFEPLPYPEAARILSISDYGTGAQPLAVTFHTFRELTERSHLFEATAVMARWQLAMTGQELPQRLEGQRVSAGYLKVLGVTPALGRDFQASDDVPNGPDVALISYSLWQRSFHGDAGVLGRQIKLDDHPFTVIGVMPKGFESVIAPSAELWAPLQYDTTNIADPNTREWGHHLNMMARIRAGVTRDAAKQELDSIAKNRVAEFPRVPWATLSQGVVVTSLQEDITRGVKPALLAVFGAVILLLLIACVNVTNLLLARGAQRRGEFAMRTALGAARMRLLRQVLTESLLLAVVGGGLGILLAEIGVRTLVAVSPPGLPRLDSIHIDAAALAFALGITTCVGVMVGFFPALHASRCDMHNGVQQTSQRTAGGNPWVRQSLVVSEVALALVLLVSGGLLLRSLQQLFSINPGFDSSHLLTMQVQTSRRFPEEVRQRKFEQVLGAVQQVPGVMSATFTNQLPLSDDFEAYGVFFDADSENNGYPSYRYTITPGYFETMKVPLLRGRLLNDHDGVDAPPVALISESLAKERFPHEEAIGHRIHAGGGEPRFYTIVGIVGGVKQESLAEQNTDAFYTTATQWHWTDNRRSLVVRTQGDPGALAAAVRQAIWSVDKDQPISRVATMDELLSTLASQRHFVLLLFELFGTIAVVLAAVGLYGVLAGSVTERTREIGVRAALGATRRDILALILRQGMAMTVTGVVLGLAGAFVATRALVSMLFGVTRLDPVTYGGVVILLLAISAMACYLPARRATRIDPMIALRHE
jgi:putative ABC transport system permease protein